MLEQFKKFAVRGNVIDLAIAVIMGGAFSKIVSSMVDDVMMPVLGIFVGGFDVSALSITVGDAVIKYGNFLQAVFDFLIVAGGIFMFIQALNKARSALEREEEVEPKAPPAPTKEQLLLEEIRDLLKEGRRSA